MFRWAELAEQVREVLTGYPKLRLTQGGKGANAAGVSQIIGIDIDSKGFDTEFKTCSEAYTCLIPTSPHSILLSTMRMAVLRSRNWFSRAISSLSSHPLRVCVVGSGPAGFYTADKMLKAHQRAEVDILDRLPTPFGLVRSGVAPDHPETKIVINQFSRVAENERFQFFGNVTLGSSVSLKELQDLYHVVVLAYGAESDHVLGIAGEDLEEIYAAREFVWWYNGHPDCRNLSPDLQSTDTAVIIGQGNVALDVARILLQPTSELETTDIASHALAALEKSSIRKVYLVGRRGPVQTACTAKELREILGIKDLFVHIQETDLQKSSADEEELRNSRIRRRVYELLCKAASSNAPKPEPGQRELHFVFFQKPDMFLDSEERRGHIAAVHLEKTTLSGKQSAVGTGEFEDIECGLLLKSIGYRSKPVDGLPFDHKKGVVPNVGGRVIKAMKGDEMVPEVGLYVCGWLKRGPTGIIATNLFCSEETVANIMEDFERGELASASSLPKPGREGLLELLEQRNAKVVTFEGWEKIDEEEQDRGALKNKPREKLTTMEELLLVASQ